MKRLRILILLSLILTGGLVSAFARADATAPDPSLFFRIRVVDDQTGRGVPLVELRTTNCVSFWTDSNGLIAFYEPGLMGRDVFFSISSHGYEAPKDGFGMKGKVLHPESGKSAEIRLKRLNIAERLYRITGGGIYRDSVLLGEKVPLKEPLLNGLVFGQDSVQPILYQDKIYWFWGDTNRPSYPLGNFHTTGGWSDRLDHGGLDPAVGVDIRYFTESPDGFVKAMCPFEGNGILVWIDGLLTLPDESGQTRLVTHYTSLKSMAQILEHGLAVWNDEKEIFEKKVPFDLKKRWQSPQSHPIRLTTDGTDYYYFQMPFHTIRMRANWAAMLDQGAYEAFTPLASGTRYEKGKSHIERDSEGHAVWGWKRDTEPVTTIQEKELLDAGLLRPGETRFLPKDVENGQVVRMHTGTVQWNAYRKKWILIAVEYDGKPSFLGEMWYSEADSPQGPWTWTRRIVTHDKYSFYNPVHHTFYDQEGGRVVYFEGTYTTTFSSREEFQTPRYDYNQMMYRLDLSDPRLAPPAEKGADTPQNPEIGDSKK
jgi:hypothetical protein